MQRGSKTVERDMVGARENMAVPGKGGWQITYGAVYCST